VHSQRRGSLGHLPSGFAQSGENELLFEFPDGFGIRNARSVHLKDHGIKLVAGWIRRLGHVPLV
jgi:hypothetical protein